MFTLFAQALAHERYTYLFKVKSETEKDREGKINTRDSSTTWWHGLEDVDYDFV